MCRCGEQLVVPAEDLGTVEAELMLEQQPSQWLQDKIIEFLFPVAAGMVIAVV
jgi:hypothetical protein